MTPELKKYELDVSCDGDGDRFALWILREFYTNVLPATIYINSRYSRVLATFYFEVSFYSDYWQIEYKNWFWKM